MRLIHILSATAIAFAAGGCAMPATPTTLAFNKAITMAQFKQIETGMSYDQVVTILGSEGEEVSRSELGDLLTIMYQWVNPGGANMNATFQNDKLVSKGQFGLK